MTCLKKSIADIPVSLPSCAFPPAGWVTGSFHRQPAAILDPIGADPPGAIYAIINNGTVDTTAILTAVA